MKTLIILLALLSTTVFAQQKGTFTDSRDKKKYNTVKIGEKTWMAENLNYAAKNSVCYDNKPANCTKYGRLYLWGDVDDICPKGWHVATVNDWNDLAGTAGSIKNLKAKTGWENSSEDNGTDSIGFTALPGGHSEIREDETAHKFQGISKYSSWLTWRGRLVLASYNNLVYPDFGDPRGGWVSVEKAYASVRCVQDYEEFLAMKKADDEEIAKRKAEEAERLKKEAEAEAKRLAFIKSISGTVTDARDKKKYKTVKIGEQVWIAENLNYAAPGSKCASAAPKKKWIEAERDTLVYYALEDKNTTTCDKYGRWYNKKTAMTACPNGFSVPTDEEWSNFKNFIGNDPDVKDSYEKELLNSKYGFEILHSGTVNDMSKYGLPPSLSFVGAPNFSWWSASERTKYKDTTIEYSRYYAEHTGYRFSLRYFDKNDSLLMNVRCVDNVRMLAKEAKEKAEAERLAKIAANIKANSGTMTDARDKKTYKTIKIGTQNWMAQNLDFQAKNSKCWGEKPDNCSTYGRLYDWENAKSACPAGWRLPNDADWDLLTATAGGKEIAGAKLKKNEGWNKVSYDRPGNGEDEFGFAGQAGGRADATYNGMGQQGCWWSFNEKNATNGNYRRMLHSASTFASIDDPKTNRFSVRCVQGASPVPPAAPGAAEQPKQAQQQPQGEVWCAGNLFGKKWCNKMPDPSTCAMSAGKVVNKCP